MRPVQHGTLVADGAGARMCRKQIDNLLRRRQFGGSRCKSLIDHIDLRRMDGQHAAEPGAPCLRRAFAQARLVTKIAMYCFDSGYTGCCGTDEAQAARQLIGE